MRGTLKFNEHLAAYTSWHIGGPADKYYRPQDLEDLAEFLAALPSEEPITWLGLGSNVLIADEGIRGIVVHMLGTGSHISSLSQAEGLVRAQAGMTCAKLAKFCARAGLVGAEFFAGIPGTIGGALAMNAGAWGGETWRHVVEVEVINRRGERFFRSPEAYQLSYRSVQSHSKQEEWFIAGHFQFEVGDPQAATLKIKELLRQRSATQPTGVFSCGSVFKNPEGHYAGQLIEAAQLKGFSIGDAQVSPKHANFILNRGHATAKDILQLIKHVQAEVFRQHHIVLQPEVRFLG